MWKKVFKAYKNLLITAERKQFNKSSAFGRHYIPIPIPQDEAKNMRNINNKIHLSPYPHY